MVFINKTAGGQAQSVERLTAEPRLRVRSPGPDQCTKLQKNEGFAFALQMEIIIHFGETAHLPLP